MDKDIEKELKIAKKSFKDITAFDNHQMDEPKSDNEAQRKIERKRINANLAKELLTIAKDYITWSENLNKISEIDDQRADNAFMGALYSVYPQNNVKYLDKAVSTQKLSDYKKWTDKIGLTDLGSTDSEELCKSEDKLLNVISNFKVNA